MFSPVHRRGVAGNAPSTPSAIVVTGSLKRLQKAAEDDDNDSLNGSSNESEKTLRQYDKWSVEEEQIFFLKLHTSSALSLLECFRCIAELLPNKDHNQVRNYYYKLKAQFQKHNPARDVDDLTQREMFQAMNSMWSLWSQNANKGGSKPRLSQRKRLPSNSIKQTRYIQSLQESLEQIFKVKDQKAELQAQKEADRVAKQKAAQKISRQAAVFERQQQQEAPRLKQQEADRKQRLAQQKAEQKAVKLAKKQQQSELESLQQQAKSQQQCNDSCQQAKHLTHQADSNSLFQQEGGCAQEGGQNQWALDQQAVERMCQLDMERWRQREADWRAEQLRIQGLKETHDSGTSKENSSLASNCQTKGQKGQGCLQLPSATVADKPAGRKQVPLYQEQPGKLQVLVTDTAARQRGRKAKGHKSVEAASVKLTTTASDAQNSDSPGSEPHSAGPTDEEPEMQHQPEEIVLTQQAEPDFADSGAGLHQLQADELQSGQQQLPQHEFGSQQQAGLQQQQVPIARQHSQSQPADVTMLMQQQQQQQKEQRQNPMALLPGFLDVLRKEPLCLRVRPLDALTKRLMQALGCTALLEMPNNKPKKAVEGLLRHLQKKWQKAASQLGDAYELHLVGLLAGQPDSCLSWKSQGISSALTLGQMQQQLQQSGPFLELSYVWLPAEGQDKAMPTVHNKAGLAARAASGYTLVTGTGQAVCQGQRSSEAAPRLPFGSPLGDDSQRQAMASTSSSSAPVFSEAFSNLQSQASAPLYMAAAASTGQRSGAGENQTVALPLDVTSSVSGLVTPCRAHQSLPQGVGHAKHDDTPRSKLEKSSAGQDLAWEGTKMLGDADFDIEPRLSQSHPHGMDHVFSTAQDWSDPLSATADVNAWPQPEAEPSAFGFQQAAVEQCSEASLPHNCSSQQPTLPMHALASFPEPSGQFGPLSSGSLSEQASGFLSREASVWSVQPPGALSAEPSGCWDDFPQAALSQEVLGYFNLPDQHDHQQLPRQLPESPTQACEDLGGRHYTEDAYPGGFEMPEYMEFELPPLDSPKQAALASPVTKADQAADMHQAQADASFDQLVPAETDQGAHAHGQQSFALPPKDEALLQQHPGGCCSQPPGNEPYRAASEGPALGLPLLGTVVMGVPVRHPIPQTKPLRPSKAKQAKPKQPKAPKATQRDLAAALGQDRAQQEGAAPAVPDQSQAVILQQPKAKSKKRRTALKPDSPCRLPPISPGALSLQEGVKRRRLARQAEAQAAVLAASAAASDCTHSAQRTEAPPHTTTDQSSEAAAAEGVVQASSVADTTGQQQARHDDGKCQLPHTEIDDEPASTSDPFFARQQADHSHQSQLHTSSRQQPGQTLSFDVAAMELFQQQDTCDAFGSFWRRTSGIGTRKVSPGVQAAPAAPIAFGAGDISLGSWTVAEQGKRLDSTKAAANRPAEESQHSKVQQAQHAKQADTPAGSGDMDLTNYFAMLPNEVVPFRDLISPLPVTASALPEQQLGSESPLGTDPLICSEHSLAATDAEADREASSTTGSGHTSGSGPRPPTEQEIKHMDELDLSINLGSLLGPGESWIVEDNDHFATLEGKADQPDQAAAVSGEANGRRPFQELFPITQS
ncbi:hypothetical protein WJX77_007331 [Trebouxia sp. C0004]